jgi:hypothetical protein
LGTGDDNRDGKSDILWRDATRGEVWVWPMDGTTKVSETIGASRERAGLVADRRQRDSSIPFDERWRLS